MKFVAANMKKIVIGAIVALSCSYGLAQAFAPIHAPPPGCVACTGCGPYGGILLGVGGTLCAACCLPPSN